MIDLNSIDEFRKVPGFLIEFITPIVKVTKARESKSFFTLPEYESWKETHEDGKGWNIKYYKGLGTSTSKEAKEYFSAMDLHRKEFRYDGVEDDALIDMAFSKKKVEERKVWLNAFEEGTVRICKQSATSRNSRNFSDRLLVMAVPRPHGRAGGSICISNDEFCIKNDEFCIK